MRYYKYIVTISIIFFSVIMFVTCNNAVDGSREKSTKMAAKSEGTCSADPEWFAATGIPEPTNGNPDSLGECGFYKWAWHDFLFITQGGNGDNEPRFLSFETPGSLFAQTTTTASNFRAAKGLLLLTPQMQKEQAEPDINEFEQAGTSENLIDQDGRVIYYAQHLNSVFVKFIKDSGYTDMNKLIHAPDTLKFPSGALELKSSWKIVPDNEVTDVSKTYFTTKAIVPVFVIDHGKIKVDFSTPPHSVTVALLGLHVVGVVDGHPEFIWSTFEHDSIAPDLPNGMDVSASSPVNSARDYILYKKGTLAKDCNALSSGSQRLTDPVNQLFDPKASILRQFPFQDELIIPLNSSVKNQLPANSVWKNYSLMGAVWMNRPDTSFKVGRLFKPNELNDSSNKAIFAGERELSNVTMETFTQATQRCFSCHRTTSDNAGSPAFPAKLMNVSHVILKAYLNSLQTERINKERLFKKK